MQWLLERNVGFDGQCQDGAKALHGAALGKHKGAIKFLLEKGAKRDVKNKTADGDGREPRDHGGGAEVAEGPHRGRRRGRR